LRRVAVNDQTAVIAPIGQERLADPDKIMLALRIERFFRIDSGVDEKTAAVVVAERERTHPRNMLARQLAGAAPAIAAQRRGAAFAQPDIRRRRAAGDIDRDRLMISFQRDHAMLEPQLE